MNRAILLVASQAYVLQYASRDPVYGQLVLGKLRRRGLCLSSRTVRALLDAMAKKGWLRAKPGDRAAKREYLLTGKGARELVAVRRIVADLHWEIGHGAQHSLMHANHR